MIQIANAETYGWEAAFRGMRNPLNSWDQSDTDFRKTCYRYDPVCESKECPYYGVDYDAGLGTEIVCYNSVNTEVYPVPLLGKNDLQLAQTLADAGATHGKFLRMIGVAMDITAPLYWWKEYDTYKVGTVANSCSTMHKITSKPIKPTDFSIDNFYVRNMEEMAECFNNVIADCEMLRKKYLETKDYQYWRALIQLLPCSYNQKRTVTLNYQVLRQMYHDRADHKLREWRQFCVWMEFLPYAELITGRETLDAL